MKRDRGASRHSTSIHLHSLSGLACQVCSVNPDQDNYWGERREVQIQTERLTPSNREQNRREEKRREEEMRSPVINHKCEAMIHFNFHTLQYVACCTLHSVSVWTDISTNERRVKTIQTVYVWLCGNAENCCSTSVYLPRQSTGPRDGSKDDKNRSLFWHIRDNHRYWLYSCDHLSKPFHCSPDWSAPTHLSRRFLPCSQSTLPVFRNKITNYAQFSCVSPVDKSSQ